MSSFFASQNGFLAHFFLQSCRSLSYVSVYLPWFPNGRSKTFHQFCSLSIFEPFKVCLAKTDFPKRMNATNCITTLRCATECGPLCRISWGSSIRALIPWIFIRRWPRRNWTAMAGAITAWSICTSGKLPVIPWWKTWKPLDPTTRWDPFSMRQHTAKILVRKCEKHIGIKWPQTFAALGGGFVWGWLQLVWKHRLGCLAVNWAFRMFMDKVQGFYSEIWS